MVKPLSDCCLQHIATHIHRYNDLGETLTRKQKEMLLKRMSVHQQLYPGNMKYVKMFLFSSSLRKIELSHSSDFIHDGFLRCLAKYDCKFEFISINKCKEVTDNGLYHLLRNQTELRVLQLTGLPSVIGTCFSQLHSHHLKQLTLKNLITLQDMYVVLLISNCPSINWLDLQYCRDLSDVSIMGLAAVLKGNLNVLKVSGVAKITDQGLESLIKNCPNLKTLKLYACNKLTAFGITKVLAELKLLNMNISYTCGYHRPTDDLTVFSSTLEQFISCGCQVKEQVLLDLTEQCKKLNCIELCGVEAVNDVVVRQMLYVSGKNWTGLDLSYCRNFTDRGLESIMYTCKNLQNLALGYWTGKGTAFHVLGKAENLKQAHCIQKFDVGGCRNIDVSILRGIISSLVNLTELNMAAILSVTDDFLIALSEYCPRLKTVNFKACKKITDLGVCSLVQCAKLVEVVLSGVNKLTDKSIFMMASNIAGSLQCLYISGCNLISPHVIQYLKDVSVDGVLVQHRTPAVPVQQIMAKNLDTGYFCRADLL